MTTVEVLGLLLALLIMGVGVAGSVLPVIPSTPLIVIAAVGHRLYFGAESASNLALGLMIGLMLFSLLLDYLASMIGARKLGATWRGVIGAVVGGLIGLFFSLPGIIIGPFLGAGLFEMMGGRPWPEATRAGFGAVLGMVFGAVGKIACCIAMILLFTFSVVIRASEAVPQTQSEVRISNPKQIRNIEIRVSGLVPNLGAANRRPFAWPSRRASCSR